eukprot:GILI01001027.1.p1 GENE.GILI01001027.1~~GILI01001027.1.p1  ORF type:complete len:608 (+),score=124.77 GILI01001027.1:98-1921(+)
MTTLSNQNLYSDAKAVPENNRDIAYEDDAPRFQSLKTAQPNRKSKGGELVEIPMKSSLRINDTNKEIDWLLVGTNHFPSAFAALMAAEPFDVTDGETIDLLVEDPFLAMLHRRYTLAAEKDINRQALSVENAAEIKKHLVEHLHEVNEDKKQRKEMVQKAKSLKASGELAEGGQKPKPMDTIAVGMDGFTVPNFLQEGKGDDESEAKPTNSSFGKNASAWISKAKDSIVAAASTPFKNSSFGSAPQNQTSENGIQTLSDVAKHVRKDVIRANRHGQVHYEVIDVFPLRSALTFSVADIAKHFPNTKARLNALHSQWSATEHARPIRQSLSALVKGESKSNGDAPQFKNNSSAFYYDATSDTLMDKRRVTLAKEGKKGSFLSYLPLPMHWEPPRHGESDAARKANSLQEDDGKLLEGTRFFASDNIHLEVQGAQEYGKALFDNVCVFRSHVIASFDANRHLIARHHRNLFLMKRIETAKLRRATAASAALAKRISTELKSKEDQAERLIDRKMAVYRRKQFLDKRRATLKENLQKHEANFKNNKRSKDMALKEQIDEEAAKRDKVNAHRLALIRIRVERLAATDALRKKRTAANIKKRDVTFSPVEYW